VFWIQVIAALAVVLVTALVAAGRGDSLGGLAPRLPPGLPDDRPIEPSDVLDLRLGIALRGYRMDEVDDALDRLADEIASRDDEIAELRRLLADGSDIAAVPGENAPAEDQVGTVAVAAGPADEERPDDVRESASDHG
jgi:DivIVA domain-containing protein